MSALLYPTSNLDAGPQLQIVRAKGVYVFDAEDNAYIEGLAGLWCTSLGYGNAEVIETAQRAMEQLSYAHLFGGKSHPFAEALADKLAAMVPVDDPRVFLGNSGSDANDTQIKLLQFYANGQGKPNKKRIIARQRAYHGVSVASSALTGLATTHAGFDVPLQMMGVIRVRAPHFYRERLEGETEDAFVDRLISELETAIEDAGAENIAAMIVEPVNGAGGVVVPPAGYLARVESVLRRHHIKLWDDEVICGFGRTGADFGATTFGFQPDMMSFAKGLSSGYQPISAAVIPGEMFDVIRDASREAGVFGHGYTYGGHPVACAVALKVIEIYERDKLFETARTSGGYLANRLQVLDQHPLVGEVRGTGLLHAVELVRNKQTGRPFDDGRVGQFAQLRCQENGLIVRAVAGNSLAICPPLVVTADEIDLLVDRFHQSLDETLEHFRHEVE